MVGVGQVILMVVGMHLLALACAAVLIIHAARTGPTVGWRAPEGGSDDGPGNDRRGPRTAPKLPGGGIPLPDAAPPRVRLRDHRRLADLTPPRERRPAREPARQPVRSD
ncbi:MAG TPA: hypothetical protein VG186_16865 [Solirubrobacteraceae bacterium]|nr:hypothetical protein [Solirubrobacteraceae bacterium]